MKLNELKDELTRNYERQQVMLANVREAEALFHDLDAEGVDIDINSYSLDVKATGNASKLARVERILYRHGYKTEGKAKADEPYFGTWFEAEGHTNLWLSFSSSVCRRVVVGSRKVEVEEPIYEIQCGEAV